MKLFLDDYRHPTGAFGYTKLAVYLEGGWTVVKSYKQFCKYILKFGLPDLISFDHDLADEHYKFDNRDFAPENYDMLNQEVFKEKTGYDCAKFLVGYCMDNDLDLPKYLVHSMNPVGRENITFLLKGYEKSRK
jgi:hypothetical protein